MEAEIGVVYETDGLHAAFDFIEQKILPLFLMREPKASNLATTGTKVSVSNFRRSAPKKALSAGKMPLLKLLLHGDPNHRFGSWLRLF